MALSADDIDAIEAEMALLPSSYARGRGHTSSLETLITDIRPINGQDVEAALAHEASGQRLPAYNIKRVRLTHHRMAQLLAGGMNAVRVSRCCGIDPQRLSFLLNHDPAFIELVAHYKANVDDEFQDFVTAASELSNDMLDELRHRLETEPEKIGAATLLEGIRTLADRSGNSPVAKNVNININEGLADRMRRGRERALKARTITPGTSQ